VEDREGLGRSSGDLEITISCLAGARYVTMEVAVEKGLRDEQATSVVALGRRYQVLKE